LHFVNDVGAVALGTVVLLGQLSHWGSCPTGQLSAGAVVQIGQLSEGISCLKGALSHWDSCLKGAVVWRGHFPFGAVVDKPYSLAKHWLFFAPKVNFLQRQTIVAPQYLKKLPKNADFSKINYAPSLLRESSAATDGNQSHEYSPANESFLG
jgi:hypothetical protein